MKKPKPINPNRDQEQGTWMLPKQDVEQIQRKLGGAWKDGPKPKKGGPGSSKG